VQKSGAKDESSRSGTLTFNMTHASERGVAARKSRVGSRIARVEKFVGSRFTPACNSQHVDYESILSRSGRAVARRQPVETERREKRSKEGWRICTVRAPPDLSVLETGGNAVAFQVSVRLPTAHM
jgi:hypothetical protein